MKTLTILPLLLALSSLAMGQITIQPSQLVGRVGENVVINCTGSEPVSITLAVESSPGVFTVPTNEVDRTNANGVATFTIGPLEVSDDGNVYRCSLGGLDPVEATLEVLFPPELSLIGEQVRMVTEGTPVMINITIIGNPAPVQTNISLTRDTGSRSVTPMLGDGVVIIYFASINRSDSGMYTLSVTTSEGTDSTTFTLDVQFPPVFEGPLTDGFICMESDNPIIPCAAVMGNDGALQCGVTANPTATLQQPIPMPVQNNVEVVNDSFVITEANANNAAVYTCNATNSIDSIIRQFQLYVGRRPAAVTNLGVMVTENRMYARVTWDYEDQDNGVPLMGFVLVLFQEDTMINTFMPTPNARMQQIPLAGLQTSTDYRVTLVARNLLGDSPTEGEAQFQTPDMIPMTTMATEPAETTLGASGLAGSLVISLSLCIVVMVTTLLY